MSAKSSSKYLPTPLHYLTFILQQSSEESLLEEVGIGLSYVRIMGALDSKTPVSQHAVAMHLRQTEANVSRQLLVMVRQRLVKITKNKNDGRQRDVTLTAKGKQKYDQAEKILKGQMNLIYKNLTKTEKQSFDASVGKIISSL